MAYNTAPFHGKVARVEKNGTLMEFTEGWEIDAEVEFDDSTYQGDNWEDQLAGIGKWTGKITGAFVAGNTEQKALYDNIINATPGTKLTDMQFNLDASTNAFTGNIHITKVSVKTSVRGKVPFEIDFKGSGAISLTDVG